MRGWRKRLPSAEEQGAEALAWAIQPPASFPTLSIIFGTYNRLRHLQQCVTACRETLSNISYEFVICDGGSTDGSREWLASQQDVVLLGDRHLDGAVAAYNRAYSMSRGRHVALLNDDCKVLPGTFAQALAVLDSEPYVGQVVIPYSQHGRVFAPQRRGHALASYSVNRRETADAVVAVSGGIWNPIYHTYAADWELSCMVLHLGWSVVSLNTVGVTDLGDETSHDTLRTQNGPKRRRDADRFFARWPRDGAPVLEEDEAQRVLIHRRQA